MTARDQVESVIHSAEFRARLLETAAADAGAHEAEELAQQTALEAIRAAAKKSELLFNPEAFTWGCYKNCKRDALRRLARIRRKEEHA